MIPLPVRVAVVLALSAGLSANAPPGMTELSAHGWSQAGLVIRTIATEAALGATMACAINMAFAIFTFAGRLLDVQIGFGIGQVFDPLTRQQLPVLGAVFNQMALVMFFVLDGHHAFMRGLALSIEAVPPGSAFSLDGGLAAFARQAGQMYSLGLAMAAPLVFGLLLVELGLGVLARNLPQMNTLVIGVPIKVLVALLLLSFWVGGSSSLASKAYASAFSTWGALWR